ncbi:hypothetical protein AM1_E0191 (plasmid) [Acaryochloris marina MBIC11017]|uniref:Uncharacterized protein n=1 Tax=Acaryochloris marina (strain MBIC 11017) TaxID=329726 RepID=A8ZPM4_ACAM1|nr:hypothetical protein AM1_E0191 [Acaryochloris marina MBIC11017]
MQSHFFAASSGESTLTRLKRSFPRYNCEYLMEKTFGL